MVLNKLRMYMYHVSIYVSKVFVFVKYKQRIPVSGTERILDVYFFFSLN
jgi:hypothetical protein